MSRSAEFLEEPAPGYSSRRAEENGGSNTMVRESVLWLVVIYDVMREAQKVRDSSRLKLKALVIKERELRWYVKGKDFEEVCSFANIDNKWAREKVLAILDGRIRIENKHAIKYQTRKKSDDEFTM